MTWSRRRRRIVTALAVVAAVGAGLVIFYGVRIAPMATRYIAQRLCAGVYVSNRSPEDVFGVDLGDGDFGFPGPFSWSIDREAKTATGMWLGTARTTARLNDGLGCTVITDDAAAIEALSAAQRRPFAEPFPFPPPSPTPAIEAALDWAFENPAARTRAVVIVHKGRLIGERYAPGIHRDTPLLGWSMNKSVMHALIGTQVLRGRLSLDQDHLFEEWKDDGRSAITLRHLLNMSSGLAWDESYTNPFGDAIEMLFGTSAAAEVPLHNALEDEPGTELEYSSGTTNLLSLLLRRTLESAGEDYLGYPQRALYAPLGMTTAVLEPDPSGTFLASSFGYASALDWARFGQLYLQDGVVDGHRLLPEGWVEQACSPAPASRNKAYGGHFSLRPDAMYTSKADEAELPPDQCNAVGHEAQLTTIIPSRQLIVVRMGFTPEPGVWNQAGLVKRVLAALPE